MVNRRAYRERLERVVAVIRAAEAVGTAGYEETFAGVGLEPGEWVLVRASDWIELLLLVDELDD